MCTLVFAQNLRAEPAVDVRKCCHLTKEVSEHMFMERTKMRRMCNSIANYVAPLTKRSMDMCEQKMYFRVSCTGTDCSDRVSSLEDTFGDTGSWHGMFLGPRELNYVPVHVNTKSTWGLLECENMCMSCYGYMCLALLIACR